MAKRDPADGSRGRSSARRSALAGAVMQGVTRNPLADPGILGVNMGASLAVVIGIAWFGLASATGFIWAAIVGAARRRRVRLRRRLARPGRRHPAQAGARRRRHLGRVRLARQRGHPAAQRHRRWRPAPGRSAASAAPRSTASARSRRSSPSASPICLLSARSLNSLALGDDLAAGLGERVAVARAVAALGAVLLCGAATAVAGPIAFVGLVVPHVCRLLVGVDHRWLLPFSALAGACLLTAADVRRPDRRPARARSTSASSPR